MHKLMAVLLFSLALSAFAGDALDNKAVVEMVKLGLDQQVISAKIDTTPNNFDTSSQALAKLKHDGVPPALISKMIEASSSTHNASISHANGNEFQFVDANGSHVAMTPVRVTAEISHRKAWIPYYFGGPETFMFLQGLHALLRTSNTPVFVTSIDPLTVRLIHLGEKMNREDRYVVFSGSTTNREIQVTTKDLGGGSYNIQPAKPLQSGEEYAFLVDSQLPTGQGFWIHFAQNAAAAKAYDFGVN